MSFPSVIWVIQRYPRYNLTDSKKRKRSESTTVHIISRGAQSCGENTIRQERGQRTRIGENRELQWQLCEVRGEFPRVLLRVFRGIQLQLCEVDGEFPRVLLRVFRSTQLHLCEVDGEFPECYLGYSEVSEIQFN